MVHGLLPLVSDQPGLAQRLRRVTYPRPFLSVATVRYLEEHPDTLSGTCKSSHPDEA